MQNINFIDPIPAHEQEQRMRWFKCTLVVFIIQVTVLSSYTLFKVHVWLKILSEEKKVRHTLEKHQLKIAEVHRLQQEISTLKKFNETIINPSLISAHLLQQLADNIPNDIYLQNFNYNLLQKSIDLDACSYSFQSIHNFVEFLAKLPEISQCNLISLHQEQKTTSHNNKSMIRFTVHILLKISQSS